MSTTKRNTLLAYLFIAPSLLVLCVLIVIPVLNAIISSVQDASGGFTFAVYREVFSTPGMWRDILFTVEVTLISCVVVMILSTLLSVYLRFNPGWLATFIQHVYYLPIFIPSIIATYALINLYQQHGWLNSILEAIGVSQYPKIVFTGTAIVLAQIWFHVPFTTLLLTSGFQGVRDGMVESARDAGAGFFRIATQILIPQIKNIALFAFTLVFLGCFGGYTVPYLLGPNSPQMLGVVVTETMGSYLEPQQASVISVIMFLICSVVASFYVINMTRSKSREQTS